MGWDWLINTHNQIVEMLECERKRILPWICAECKRMFPPDERYFEEMAGSVWDGDVWWEKVCTSCHEKVK
jgi:hypothetical protein